MPENGNNPSELENDIIDQIVITIAIMLDNLIKDYKNSEEIMEDYRLITSSPTNVTRAFTSLILMNVNSETGVSPAKIKRQLIEMSTGFYEKSQKDFLDNSPNLSKVLKEFEDAGIIFSIVGKKKIKEKSPKSITRKPKAVAY